jgi:hypothetical protein
MGDRSHAGELAAPSAQCAIFLELSDKFACRREQLRRRTGDPLLFPLGLLALRVGIGRFFDFSDTRDALW